MRAFATLLTVATLLCRVIALPATTCATLTSQVIVPTTTYTFNSTYVTTAVQTTPHLGTWTTWVFISETITLRTLTTTTTDCTAYGTITEIAPVTAYPTPETSASYSTLAKRGESEQQTPSCTVTATVTTSVGATWVYIPTNQTSTYTEYTAWSMETISSTSYTGTSFVVATATAKTCQMCGPTTTLSSYGSVQPTASYDAKCLQPTSAGPIEAGPSGHGIKWLSEDTYNAATFRTTASNPQACCQLCVEQSFCSGSAWDIRSNACHLEFLVDLNGNPTCGAAGSGYYDSGPIHPMAPGSGWYLMANCGSWQTLLDKPDDGT